MQIEVFESAPSALNQLVRVRGDGAQPGGRAADRAGAWAAADGPGRVLQGSPPPPYSTKLC